MNSAAREPGAPTSAFRLRLDQIARSRLTFVGLQIFDLLTTLAVFRLGGVEMNPLVANLTREFGPMRGLLISKLAAVAIAMGVRRFVWVINLFYTAVVAWNVVVLLLSSVKHH